MRKSQIIRFSTGVIPGGLFYHVVPDPDQDGEFLCVISNREVIPITPLGLKERGLISHPDYLRETKDSVEYIFPPGITGWGESSLRGYMQGALPPTTLRGLYNEIFRVLKQYIWLPFETSFALLALLPFLSFWIVLFPAVPIIELCGPVGSGKSTLGKILCAMCRSSHFCSTSTAAALARIRSLDPATLVFDEPLRHGKEGESLLLGSYKRDSFRLICSPNNGIRQQSVFGLTIKVVDSDSAALRSRSITIETAPSPNQMPFFVSEDESRHSNLCGTLYWLSLSQKEDVLEAYRAFMSKPPVHGRESEKWAPLIAIAQAIDRSDPQMDPIVPPLLGLMEEQLDRQRQERASTDPELLVLEGIRHFADTIGMDRSRFESAASDLAAHVTARCDASFTVQQIGNFLKRHGVLVGVRRSRSLNGTVHPQTLYEIDLIRLESALRVHGINPTKEA